jgi:hypothetical protein
MARTVSPGGFLSQRAYATHRRELALKGTTHQAVGKAIATGRLVESVHERAGRKLIDPVLADAEWERNTDPGREPLDQAGGRPPGRQPGEDDQTPSLFGQTAATSPEARARSRASAAAAAQDTTALRKAKIHQAVFSAKLRQLDYEVRRAELVEAHRVRAAQFALGRQIQQALIKIPNRVAGQVATMSGEASIRRLLEEEIRDTLQQLVLELEQLEVPLEAASA